MINTLCGADLLPSSPVPTSANLVRVHSGEEYARVFFRHEKPRRYLAPYDYDMVRGFCKDGDQVTIIELSHKGIDLPEQVVIMDTPGIDSADDAHRLATEDALHMADMIFYVMDYNHVQSELNFSFTRELTKAGKDVVPLARGEYKGAVTLNQGKKVKKDTVMAYKDKHYHAYTQVNPTTYKVYRQTTNSDGLRVESIYYDNIVYIALYEGQQKVFGSNITKAEFSTLVPQAYLDQAVLSEIIVDRAGEKGVRFIAVLSIPDSYTNYRVNIDIDAQGKKTLSV